MSRLFWPVLAEQILTMMIGIVSTMLVSNVGAGAQSGVSLVDQFNNLFITILFAIATGTTVAIAHMIGAGKPEAAGKTAQQSLITVTGMAVILGTLILFFGEQFLRFLFGNAEASVLSAAKTYVFFSAFSYPFAGIYAVCAGIMRASGNSKTPLLCIFTSNIVNIVLASILIFTLKMGVYAVSISMLCARMTSGLMGIYMLKRGKAGFMLPKLRFKIDGEIMKPVLNVGIPAGIDQLMLQGVRVTLASFISGMGTSAIQANSISNSLNLLIMSAGTALMIVSTTVVGQAYGARDYERARQATYKICINAVVIQAIIAALIMLFFKQIISLYHPTPQAYDITLKVMQLNVFIQPIGWTGGFILAQVLRSVGEAKYSMKVAVAALFTIRLTGAWLMSVKLGWGVQGIWVSMYLDWVMRIAFFIPKFLGKGWELKAEKRWAEKAAAETARLEEEIAESESEEVREAPL
jgi:putative MATE family efflux protein